MSAPKFDGVPDDDLADWHPTGPGMGSWQVEQTPVSWVRLVGIDGQEPEVTR